MMKAWAACGLAAMAFGCGDDGDDTTDTSADTDAAVETSPDTTVPDAATEATPDTSPAVTWGTVYPFFKAACSGCHTSDTANGGPSGGHSIASSDAEVAYDASQIQAKIAKCAGKTVGECALIRIQDGSMPASGECADPVQPRCPTLENQALIQQWIDAGMPE